MTDPDDALVLVRTYDAEPEELFAAWIDTAKVEQWFGCGFPVEWTFHAWEARPGGALHVEIAGEDGEPIVVHGEFLVVDAPRTLKYIWDRNQTVTVEFRRTETGTELTLTHRLVPEPMTDIVTQGWTHNLGQLSRYATSSP